MFINFYTDGSSKGNPGAGGFGVVVLNDKILDYTYFENCDNTTNNREELKAILHALKLSQSARYKDKDCIIFSDSSYCVNICNNWIYEWASADWKRKGNKEIKNLDIIKEIYNYINIDFFNCQIVKIPGHQNIIGNELADSLATGNVNKFNRIIKNNQILCN